MICTIETMANKNASAMTTSNSVVTVNCPTAIAIASTSFAKNRNSRRTASKFRHSPPPKLIYVKLAAEINTLSCDSDSTSLYDSLNEAETGLYSVFLVFFLSLKLSSAQIFVRSLFFLKQIR